jgi:hypothetical protein
MEKEIETRVTAIEDMLGHLMLMLETEPRFRAVRMGQWLRTVTAVQPPDKSRTDALLALWARIKLGAK